MIRVRSSALAFLRRFGADQGGVSAIEFAFIAPILIIFYFGMAETCQLLMAKRKISHAAAAVADLVSQTSTPSTDTLALADTMLAANTIVAPFSSAPDVLQLRLHSVSKGGTATAPTTVDWSYPAGGPAKGSPFTPSTPLNANESVIVTEVSYGYTSPIGYFIPGVKQLTHKAELRPRKQDKITCTDC